LPCPVTLAVDEQVAVAVLVEVAGIVGVDVDVRSPSAAAEWPWRSRSASVSNSGKRAGLAMRRSTLVSLWPAVFVEVAEIVGVDVDVRVAVGGG
jgi:hypothetical protein